MGPVLPSAGWRGLADSKLAAWGPVRPNAKVDHRGMLVCHAQCRTTASHEVEHAMHITTFAEGGLFFATARIAEALRRTKEEVARTVDLARDALMRRNRRQSPKTQKRLREMIEMLTRVEPRFGWALIPCLVSVGVPVPDPHATGAGGQGGRDGRYRRGRRRPARLIGDAASQASLPGTDPDPHS